MDFREAHLSKQALANGSLALVFLGLVVAQPAQAWRAKNLHDVYQISEGVYEVVSEPGSGPQHFWCAIADYALRKDRKSSSDFIYLLTPIGASVTKPGWKSVQFGYEVDADSDPSVHNRYSITKVGSFGKVGLAIQFCANGLETPIDWPKR